MRGGLGNPQDHGVAVGDKDIAHAVRARTSREQCKTAPEERMGGISDLDFRQVVYRWVIDRGIKMFDRSTTLIIRCWCGRSGNTRPVHGSSCMSYGGSKPRGQGRMGPAASGGQGSRKGVVSALSARLSSSLMRSMPGGSENSRPSPARAR